MLVGLFLLLAAPTAVQVATTPAPAEQSAASDSLDSGPYRSDAMELAQSVVPKAAFHAMMDGVLRKGMVLGLGDEAATMEKQSPGVMAELEQVLATSTRPHIERYHRTTVEQYARLYSRSFSPQELTSVTAFYRSPTGAKIIARKYGYMTEGDNLSKLISSDDAVTSKDVADINRGVVAGLMTDLTAEDQNALVALTKSPAFLKMQSLVKVINEMEARVANEDDPALEAAISTAVEGVMKKRKLID